MSEFPPTPPIDPTSPNPDAGAVPTARPAGIPAPGSFSGGKIHEPSLLDVVDDTCPKCGAKLPHEAVVCVACGYDLKSNVVHRVDVPPSPIHVEGDDWVDDEPANDEFVEPGRGSAKVMAIAGGVLTLGAMVVAGIVAGQAHGAGIVVLKVAVVLYETLLNAGTGVVAVYAAARFCEKKFGPAELAAARMLAAFALFELVRHIPIAVPYIGAILQLIAAMAVYFLAIWLLFGRTRFETAMIATIHFVLWLLVTIGMILSYNLGATGITNAATGGAGG